MQYKVLALLLIAALLQPVQGSGLAELLREFGLEDAGACLELNGVLDHHRMSMMNRHHHIHHSHLN